MAKLFEPLKIKGVEFRNRIIVSPMCEYSSNDGFANDWHLVHLGSRAVGGAALVFTEAAAVSPEGRISPDDLGIWKDEHIDFLKKIVSFIHEQGAVAGIQLAHAGRKASVDSPWKGGKVLSDEQRGWLTVSPSPVPFKEGDKIPHELTKDEIKKVVNDFRDAAVRSLKCGFKVVEIHAAHGYLINEFYSPVSNLRTDEYGGSFENRIKLLLEVVEAIQGVWPNENPLFVRITSSEWSEKGWQIGDSVKLAKVLKDKGVDLIDCSSGGNVYKAKIEIGPMYQVPFAEQVKKGSGIMTAAVGLITTAQQCEDILESGKADMVLLARQLLRDPYFPLHAAKELGVDVKWPDQYLRAKQRETRDERRETRNGWSNLILITMFLALAHKKFDVYKVSSQLLLECYSMAINLPFTEQYNLVQQIKRAAVSVRLNLAEGSSRKSSLERKRFYEIARGSLIEIDTAFEICVELNYFDKDDLTNLGNLLNRSFSMITKMIYVNS